MFNQDDGRQPVIQGISMFVTKSVTLWVKNKMDGEWDVRWLYEDVIWDTDMVCMRDL